MYSPIVVYQLVSPLQKENERLKKFLKKIALGEGRYSLDHQTHADNTIEDMKKLAEDALAGKEYEE